MASNNTSTKALISEAINVATSIPDANAIFLFMTVVYQKGSLRNLFSAHTWLRLVDVFQEVFRDFNTASNSFTNEFNTV